MTRLLAALLLLAAFLVQARAAAPQGWTDFHAIMWQPQTAIRYRGLHKLGVDAGKAFGFRGKVDATQIPGRLAPLLESGTPFYLENLATDFYAPYHRWTPEHPAQVTWLFDQTRQRYRANPADPSVFVRTPGLSDPVWLDRIAGRMRENGRAFAAYRPLFYNLGDETGIADLSAAWDFDRAPDSLAAMRVWLRGQYASLAALNRQWGTAFAAWRDVVPETTTQALARTDGNYASWADFRSFMDHAFAHALRVGTEGLHAGDPHGLAGIEGTQAPGPGGYDYIRLAHAVDVMEMYGAGDSTDIARSFNPDLVVLTTGFGGGPPEQRRIWHSMLQGARGLVIWDDANTFVDDSGAPSARARELAPLLHELRGGLGAQLIATRPAPSPVAILYSPLSQHLQWLEDRRGETTPWTDRTAEAEWLDNNRMRRSVASAVSALVHLGLSPHFVSAEMLAQGLLSGPAAPRALVLSQAVALPAAATAAIRGFAAAGGVVLADGPAGTYDGHGTRLEAASLAALAPHMPPIAALPQALARAGITAGFVVRQPDGSPARDIATRVLRTGGVTLLALERDAPAKTPDPAAKPVAETVELVLAAPAAIHDLRAGTSLTGATRIAVTLDGVAPGLLAISPAPLPGPTLSGPPQASAGTEVRWTLGLAGAGAGAAHALRIRVFNPAGAPVAAYSGVRVLTGAGAAWTVRFADDDQPGRWRIEATDILSGQVARAELELRRP